MREMNKRIKEAAAAIVKKAVFTVYLFTVIAPGGMYGQGRMDGSRGVKREASEIVAQKVIGQEGGVLEAEGVRFVIPEGAVEEEVAITISRLYEVADSGEIKNVTAGFCGWRFLPEGMKFKRACELSLEYDTRIEGEDAQGIYTYYYDKKEKRWVALERKRVDEEGKRIESYTDHFTDMINGTLSLPESPDPVRVNLNSIKELKAADAAGGIERIEGLRGGSDGSASCGITLKVPEGVKGMAPELSLRYESGSGWGLVGKGWNISGIESVSVDTRFGLPEYNGKDTYIVDGSRVKYEGNEWVKERERGYERIENAWVERRSGDEGNYFKITGKDGREKVYGKEVWSGKGKGAKYQYYLDSERDSFGNEIRYEYEKEDGADGQYLNTVASETNDVYLRQGSDDNITNTRISTREEFNKVTAAVFGESSGNAAESNAIADVIMNRATSTGRTISDIVENTGIYGYNENSRTTTDNGVASNTDTTLNTARAAAIHGYTGTDTSSGAYFWEGTTFLDPQSQNYNPTNWFVRMGWGTTVGTTSNVISYLVTTTIGRTTFMRNNPQYRRVDYP